MPWTSTRSSASRETVQALLDHADVRINGDRPWDVRVHDARTFDRLLSQRSLGAGEAYMDGWWDCDALDVLFDRVIRANLETKLGLSWAHLWNVVQATLMNRQRRRRATASTRAHYDRGNDLFEAMLDARMVYSCGYWRRARTLPDAQEAKLDLICRKLDLQPGMRLLDLGCGWGGFLEYAASQYGVEGTGVTLSEEQAAWARAHCADWPVEIRIQDYRDVEGTFDRVVGIEILEHVGPKNYTTFMQGVRRHLASEGLALLQVNGRNGSEGPSADPWIVKYIFPDASLPSATELTQAIGSRFVIEDWHGFGADFDPTMMAWARNVAERWDALPERYDERFRRMWRYYLLQCAGIARSRHNNVWQIVLSPKGVPGGYRSIR
jgi:cyclopropane-fatty-acyl-phospholipid synthase